MNKVNPIFNALSLSYEGNVLAIGNPTSDENGNNSGVVKIYIYTNGDWYQAGDDIHGLNDDHKCGSSISTSYEGDIVSISSPGRTNNKGQVRLFSAGVGAFPISFYWFYTNSHRPRC